MRFSVSAALTVFVRVSAVLLMGVASIVIARVLGPEGQGVIAAILAVVTILLQFGNLGLYASNIRFVGGDRKLYPKAAGNSLVIGAGLGGVLFLFLAAAAVFFPSLFSDVPRGYLLVYAASLPFALTTMLFQGLLLATDKIKSYNALIFSRASAVFGGAILILYVAKLTLWPLIVFLFLVEVLISLAYVVRCFMVERFKPSLDLSYLKRMVGYGVKVFLATQLTYLVLKFDILMVNYFLDLTQTGIYSVSAKVADLLYLVPSTVALIYFPRATALKDKARPFTNRVLLVLGALMFVACIILFFAAGPVTVMLFGPAYEGSVYPLKILVPGIFFISLECVLMNYYASKTMPLFAVATPVVGLAVNVGLNIVFIPVYGIAAAAWSSTIAYTLMFVMLLVYYMLKKNE